MSRPRLPRPIAPLLDDALPADAQELWARVVVKVSERRRTDSRSRGVAFAAVGLAVAALATWVGTEFLPALQAAREPGPLHLADGSALPLRLEAKERGRDFALSDGSRIRIAAGGRLDVLASSGRALSTALRYGRAAFDVRPHGPRVFGIDCGALTIEVVGTAFELEREGGFVSVSVTRGVVVVRGELVPDHAQRLTAGHALRVAEAKPAPGPAAPAAAQPQALRSEPSAPPRPEAQPKPQPVQRAWRAAAQRAQWQAAYAALERRGMRDEASAISDVADLLLLADVARLSGHPAEAIAPLERVVREHPQNPRAALSAFTLGRIRLDTLSDPLGAARDLERALELGLPRALGEDAEARLVEAYARAGRPSDTAAAAKAYRAHYPNGRRRAAVDAISPNPAPER